MTVLFISIANETDADDYMSFVFGGDQTGSFSVRLSASGQEPASHLGAFALMPEDIEYPVFIDAVATGDFIGAAAERGLQRIVNDED